MQNDLVPQALRASFNQFLRYLEQLDTEQPAKCPYCKHKVFSQTRAMPLTFRCRKCAKYFNPLTKTPFNRLQPVRWLAVIFIGRVNLFTYQRLADELDCSVKMVTHRDRAVMHQMQTRFPQLYQWYFTHNDMVKNAPVSDLPKAVNTQHLAFKQKITKLLMTSKAKCLYCNSKNTTKISERTAFYCRDCRRSFNLLAGTPISRLRSADKWLEFIDLLVTKHDQNTIANKLGFDTGTVGNWRRVWCAMMRQWDFDHLATWCQRRGSF
ncbi:hypothetical protein RHO14_05290 [Orbus wheelerorum]|uniref:hypothetical protein n=1 Tax=Orbus wheelerorum TaxID=3074111 RepID=UPI00370D752A